MTGRELLLGVSFHVAPQRQGLGSRLAAWGRVLAGVAISPSESDRKFDSPGVDRGRKGGIESTMIHDIWMVD